MTACLKMEASYNDAAEMTSEGDIRQRQHLHQAAHYGPQQSFRTLFCRGEMFVIVYDLNDASIDYCSRDVTGRKKLNGITEDRTFAKRIQSAYSHLKKIYITDGKDVNADIFNVKMM